MTLEIHPPTPPPPPALPLLFCLIILYLSESSGSNPGNRPSNDRAIQGDARTWDFKQWLQRKTITCKCIPPTYPQSTMPCVSWLQAPPKICFSTTQLYQNGQLNVFGGPEKSEAALGRGPRKHQYFANPPIKP